MHALPPDVDLSFLEGKQLQSIGFTTNEVILHFDDTTSIYICTDIAHKSKMGEVTAVYKTIIPSAPMLLSFMIFLVTKVSVILPSTVILEFSNGESIEIYDTSEQYESFHIKYGNKIIVV